MTLNEILEQYRRGERGLPTYAELAEIDAALRAQADAQPAGYFFKASRLHPWVQVEADCPNGVPLYTHPAPEAAQALSEEVRDLLAQSKNFIIHPAQGGDDGLLAADTVERIDAILTRASAATVAEPSAQAAVAKIHMYSVDGEWQFAVTDADAVALSLGSNDVFLAPPQAAQQQAEPQTFKQLKKRLENQVARIDATLANDDGQAKPVGDERSARQLERAAAIVRWVIHVLDLIAKADSMQHGRLNLSYERDSFSRALAKLHEAETLISAQSGQRAGVAELCEIADNIVQNAETQPKTDWGNGYRQACTDIAGGLRLRALAAAPTPAAQGGV